MKWVLRHTKRLNELPRHRRQQVEEPGFEPRHLGGRGGGEGVSLLTLSIILVSNRGGSRP